MVNAAHSIALACELFPYLALLAAVLLIPHCIMEGRR